MTTRLAAYAAARYIVPRIVSASDAARAMYALNFGAKGEYLWFAPTIYQLKSRLMESLYRSNYCYRVTMEAEATGPGWLWLLTYVVGGEIYTWHCPARDAATWLTGCYAEPMPPWTTPVVVGAGLHERLAVVRAYLSIFGSTR